MEISTVANDVYKHNFPTTRVVNRNIESLSVAEIEKMNINAIFMSPPCQPFTKNGLQKDANDPRTASFVHLLKLIPKLTNLKYILLENVEPFERSTVRQSFILCLQNSKFNYKECILSPCDFGVPNSRRRYFLIAKKNNLASCYSHLSESRISCREILTILADSEHYKKMKMKYCQYSGECPPLSYIIEDNLSVEKNLIDSQLVKRLNVLDIRTPDSQGSCCFTSAYGRYAEGTGSVYTELMEADVRVIQEKLKNHDQYLSPDTLKLANSLQLRYFTPTEVSRLMCFPEKFSFPNQINMRQKYKLLGNSINVHVASHLILLLNYLP